MDRRRTIPRLLVARGASIAAALLLAMQTVACSPAVRSGSSQPLPPRPRMLAHPAANDAAPRLVSDRDIVEAARISATQMAPDGSRLLYELTRADVASNSRTRELWLASSDGREAPVRLLSRTAARVAPSTLDAQFVPVPTAQRTSSAVSYLAADPDPSGIVEAKLARNVAESATEGPDRRGKLILSAARFPADSSVLAHRWSPDGRHLALIVDAPLPSTSAASAVAPSTTAGAQAAFDIDNLRWPYAPGARTRRLWLFDRVTHRLDSLTSEALDVESVSWSPDGRCLAIAAAPPRQSQPASFTDLFLLTLAGRVLTPLVQQPGWDMEPAWSHDGRRIAFITQRGRLDWNYVSLVGIVSVPDEGAHSDGGAQPIHYVGESIDEQLGSMPSQPFWNADDTAILITAGYHMRRHIFAVDARTGGVDQGTSADGDHAHVSPSADGRTIALSVSPVDAPADVHVASTMALSATHLVSSPNPRWRERLRLPRLETVEWPSEDSRFTVSGALLLPPDFREGAAYPVILFAAGGPSMIRLGFNLGEDVFPHLAWAAQGYVVFAPNTRGRRGYGRAFREAPVARGHLFDGPFDDLSRGLDLLRQRGIIQDDRVGIAGFSYGGALATFAITRTDRFKAAVILEGRPNYLRMVTSLGGRADDLQLLRDQQGLAPVWDPGSLDRLIAHSPILSIHRAATPTMLVYGEESGARTDGIDLLRALRHFDVPSRLRVYPRTGHVIQEPSLLLDSFSQATGWFDRWLKPTAVNRPVPAPARH